MIGSGFLGSNIIQELDRLKIQSVGTSYNADNNTLKVDVRNINSINDCIQKVKPDIMINCAANVQLDYLENNPEVAFSINSEGARNVAKLAKQNEIRLIHISTDGVFDGLKGMYSEDDIPHPINVYARSKLLGEEFVKENTDDYIIIRTNFYGYHSQGKFLFNWIINTLKQNKELTGFDDVIFTPLEVINLSRMISEIAITNYRGIIHLASDEAISKYQFALKIADIFHFNKDLIKKGSVDEANFIAKRPKNTSLLNIRSKHLITTPIVSLSSWLHDIKTQLENSSK